MIGLNDGYYNFSSIDDGSIHDILKELDYIFSEKESFMLNDGNMESTLTISQKKNSSTLILFWEFVTIY